MQNINNFTEAKKALYKYIPHETGVIKYNLDNMKKLMDYLGNPQNNLKIVHIAGTSGKTSTSYYVASLLKQAGHTVGLTVSPHIDEINERSQINLSILPEAEYCSELSQFLYLVESSGVNPSYFELLIAFAYWLFNKRNVEYAVVEVGLGGLMDCTNVINRTDKVCVITDIGLDHTKILGNSVSKIAYQKAGIIQKNNNIFMYHQGQDIMEAIEKRCSENNANNHIIESVAQKYKTIKSLPLFQKRNLNLAINAVNYILKRDLFRVLTEAEIQSASKVYIPGRMEVAEYKNKTIIIDGSHNEQKINALVDSIKQQYHHKEIALLVSFGENKRASVLNCLKSLHTISNIVVLTSFNIGQDEHRKSINPSEMSILAHEVGFSTIIVETDPKSALELLLNNTTDIGLVTGSFYLLNHVREVVLE
jgi:dihydrofolate synthase/folylpolyglutamate synthase